MLQNLYSGYKLKLITWFKLKINFNLFLTNQISDLRIYFVNFISLVTLTTIKIYCGLISPRPSDLTIFTYITLIGENLGQLKKKQTSQRRRNKVFKKVLDHFFPF